MCRDIRLRDQSLPVLQGDGEEAVIWSHMLVDHEIGVNEQGDRPMEKDPVAVPSPRVAVAVQQSTGSNLGEAPATEVSSVCCNSKSLRGVQPMQVVPATVSVPRIRAVSQQTIGSVPGRVQAMGAESGH